MTKLFKFLFLLTLTLSLASCSDDDDNNGSSERELSLDINGLENLGNDYVYEGWIITSGLPVSTGRFSVNDNGDLSENEFDIEKDLLMNATTFVLTIEPKNGDDPAPSDVHILAGNFNGDSGRMTIDHPAALGHDFSSSDGTYILATPTNGPDSDEKSGIWFLDASSGSPEAGLTLPDLPDGWIYEGWVVHEGTPITTGTFDAVDMADNFDGFSGSMSGPPFPGEDFLVNAPSNVTFPLDLSGGKAVISIEPVPDNSDHPFLLKPLVGDIPSDAADHTNYNIGQNLSFPEGTFERE